MFGYEKETLKDQKDNISQRWRVLHLPYFGTRAELYLKRIRGMLLIENRLATIKHFRSEKWT